MWMTKIVMLVTIQFQHNLTNRWNPLQLPSTCQIRLEGATCQVELKLFLGKLISNDVDKR